MGDVVDFFCCIIELICWIIFFWFNICVVEVLLGWFWIKVIFWSSLVFWFFAIVCCGVRLICCWLRIWCICFCWLFKICCNWILIGEVIVFVFCLILECFVGVVILIRKVCVVGCFCLIDCGWIFCIIICFWIGWDCCCICWNNCCDCIIFCVGFCCVICWSSCLIIFFWIIMFCGWVGCIVCVVSCGFCFNVVWSCVGFSIFCCIVCIIDGCCCWLDSFCWINCWICLIWFVGNVWDWTIWGVVCWVIWIVGFWFFIKFKSCCVWISCVVWFCCWIFFREIWFIIVCTCGVIWFDICCRSILCCVLIIWGGDDIVLVWGNILGCLGVIRLIGVVERIGCKLFGDDLLVCIFLVVILVFIFVLELILFNVVRCFGDIFCCLLVYCFCVIWVIRGNFEFIICILRFFGDLIVELFTVEEILGVLGWIGMGFLFWNVEVDVIEGLGIVIIFGEVEIVNLVFLILLIVLLVVFKLGVLRILVDIGIVEGIMLILKGVFVFLLVFVILLLLIIVFINVFWGVVDELMLVNDVLDLREGIFMFDGNVLVIVVFLVVFVFNVGVVKRFRFT